jgi:6-phosphogluconolactonase (cycloisomerase 2 family)
MSITLPSLQSLQRGESVTSSASNAPSAWEDEMGAASDQLFLVTSYSDFDKLAHGPRGTEAKNSLYVYRFHPSDGSLVLLNVLGDPHVVVNPAFSRHHPRLNVVYTCTEDIYDNGKIFAYSVGANGELTQLGDAVDAQGTSTCYLTIDRSQQHLLAVNYWDSTLVTMPIDVNTGELKGPVQHTYDPKEGKKMIAAGRSMGGCNHSHNDDSTIRMRQADPHSHALVLDPFLGTVAYVPDLGKDVIREFYYDRQVGKIALELNVLPSGLCTGQPDGPRYFEFHPRYNVAYVVNELSSTIAVFEVDRFLVQEIAQASASGEDMMQYKGRSTLRLIQSIRTLPSAFPTTMNTCGRICVHQSGRFVVVSNRGHQSIAVFRVRTKGPKKGELCAVGYFHTRGETPRHFQFDASGQYMLVANQDTDSMAIFNFNLSSGEIKFTGNEYRVPSPNFICCCPIYGDDEYLTDDVFAVTKPTRALTTDPPPLTGLALATEQHGMSMPEDSESTTSEQSSLPVLDEKELLRAELARAREEIAMLRQKLSNGLQ